MQNRSDLIVKKFEYLIVEYGFEVKEKNFDPEAMGNAYVIFMSLKNGIEIVVDRNDVLIAIGDSAEPRQDWFEFSDVVGYYAPSMESVYHFPEKTEDQTWDEFVEVQLDRLSGTLRQICEPLLRGESLKKKEIKKIEEQRVSDMFGKFMRNA
jgi:hypothetical protein